MRQIMGELGKQLHDMGAHYGSPSWQGPAAASAAAGPWAMAAERRQELGLPLRILSIDGGGSKGACDGAPYSVCVAGPPYGRLTSSPATAVDPVCPGAHRAAAGRGDGAPGGAVCGERASKRATVSL